MSYYNFLQFENNYVFLFCFLNLQSKTSKSTILKLYVSRTKRRVEANVMITRPIKLPKINAITGYDHWLKSEIAKLNITYFNKIDNFGE